MASNICRECGANFDSDAQLTAHLSSAHPGSVQRPSSSVGRAAGSVGAGAAGVAGAAGAAVAKVPGGSSVSNAARGAEQKLTGQGEPSTGSTGRDDPNDERQAAQGRMSENEDTLRESRDPSTWSQDEREEESELQKARRDPRIGEH